MKYFVIFTSLFVFLSAKIVHAENIELLYVNANVGASAGGHTALKLGDDVFHYQFFPDERFLLVRESWPHFRLIYNRLRNRKIYSATCLVSKRSYKKIKSRFTTILASQQADFYHERLLQEQIDLLGNLLSGDIRIDVAGLGFFDPATKESEFGVSLRSSIQKALGNDFLIKKKKHLDAGLQKIFSQEKGSPDDLNERIELLTDIIDSIKKRAALDVLITGTGAMKTALVGENISGHLDSKDLTIVTKQLRRLEQTIRNLLNSKRSDNGELILLQTARYHAIQSSLQRGELFTLDPFPNNASAKSVDRNDSAMMEYLGELSILLSDKRKKVIGELRNTSGTASDLLFAQLENVNGKLAEISQAADDNSSVRIASEQMIPSRKRVEELSGITIDRSIHKDFSAHLERQQENLRDEMNIRYHYHLLAKNCVNELLNAINTSFADSDEAEEALGGYIDPVLDRIVIPNDFFYQLTATFRLVDIKQFRSRRLVALDELSSNQNSLELWFQEGNTLTSTLYTPQTKDTPFIFFTDDTFWARPLLGLCNLFWAAGHTIGGMVSWPVNGGDQLYQGARGIFYTLPELVFSNIRKGTYRYEDLTERLNQL